MKPKEKLSYKELEKLPEGSYEVIYGEVGILISREFLGIRSADVVYISKKRAGEKPAGILEVPPELVVEIVPPSNTYTEIEEKVMDYLRAGVDRFLLIDPKLGRSTLFKKGRREAEIYSFEEEIELLPNLKVRLSEVLR